MKITRAVVPSLFTTLNVFCGFLSIVNAHDGKFMAASLFILLAGVFDTLDGMMARITKSSSQFGVELDSLADVVSFGAAPAFLVYEAQLFEWGTWGLILASMPLIFGAIRLARFNVQLVGFDKDYFSGLPIPMQAITVAAFILQYHADGMPFVGWMHDALAPLVVALSLLMVSTIRYDTMPKLTKRQLAAHPWKVVSFGIGGLLVIFSKGALLFPGLVVFILVGIVRTGLRLISGKPAPEPAVPSEELPSIDI